MGRAVTEDNRIPEIRAVLDEYVRPDDLDGLHAVRRRIGAILDTAPPAPRVFFPGEEIPPNTWVLGAGNWLREPASVPWTVKATPHVEVFVPSMAEYDAIVRRAREDRTTVRASVERAIPEPTEGQNP